MSKNKKPVVLEGVVVPPVDTRPGAAGRAAAHAKLRARKAAALAAQSEGDGSAVSGSGSRRERIVGQIVNYEEWLAVRKEWTCLRGEMKKLEEIIERKFPGSECLTEADIQSAVVCLRDELELAECLERKLDDFQKRCPYAGFEPWVKGARVWSVFDQGWRDVYHPSQGAVYRAYCGGARRLFVSGGENSGKTAFVVGKLVHEELLKGPGRTVCIVAKDLKLQRDDVQKRLWEFRPSTELSPKQRPWIDGEGFGKDDPHYVIQRSGWPANMASSVIFRTYEGGYEAFLGVKANMVVFNEAPPGRKWLDRAEMAVSDSGGTVVVCATYLYGDEVSRWLSDEGKSRYRTLYLDSRDNPKQSREELEKLREVWGEEVWSARVLGKAMSMGGRVYPEFEIAEPFVTKEVPPLDELALLEGIDWHGSRATAYLLCGVDDEGVMWVLRELEYDGGDPMELCRLIWEMRLGMVDGLSIPDLAWHRFVASRFQCLRREDGVVGLMFDDDGLVWPSRPSLTLLDSHIKDFDATFGFDLGTLFEAGGVDVVPAERLSVKKRHDLVRSGLTGVWNQPRGVWGPGKSVSPVPQIRVSSRCPRLAYQLRNLEYDANMSKTAVRRHGLQKEEPLWGAENDLADALGYVWCQSSGILPVARRSRLSSRGSALSAGFRRDVERLETADRRWKLFDRRALIRQSTW